MAEGRMTVQLFERSGTPDSSVQRGEAETRVLAAVISSGDRFVHVSMDEQTNRWDIEIVGESQINHV